MTANYLLRVLLDNGIVDVSVVAKNDDQALALSLDFVGYGADFGFELYDVSQEVARRVC